MEFYQIFRMSSSAQNVKPSVECFLVTALWRSIALLSKTRVKTMNLEESMQTTQKQFLLFFNVVDFRWWQPVTTPPGFRF